MPTLTSRPPGRHRSLTERAVMALAAGLALVLALPNSALAAPGDLDPSFGTGGRVSIDQDYFAYFSEGEEVALQPDGRIVTAGTEWGTTSPTDFSVKRHNADGTVDTSFGTGGEVVTDFEGGDDQAHSVALQPDGKIVVVGRTERPEGGCCWFTVARYTAEGSLDTTFGGGDGWLRTDFGSGGADDAQAVLVDSEGRIVAAGQSGGRFAVARYLPGDGSPDPSFGGGDGRVTTTFEGGALGYDMAFGPDGRIVVVGYSGSTSFDFAVARYNTDGSPDTSFSGDGRVTTDLGGYNWGRAVVVQSSGKIVASGSTGDDFTLVRYNSDGGLDGGFGTGGVVTTDFGPGSAVRELAVQPDDRIVAGGAAGGDFALARYNPDGSPDTGFGTGGRTTTDFGAEGAAVLSLALQSDGRIVAYGSSGDDRALARYLGGAGTPPPPPPPPAGVDLAVGKTGTGTVSIGDRATYTVTVTNNSTTDSATGVTLTDTLTGPAASVISATPSQGTCTTSATGATCALGTLAPGTGTVVTVVAEPRATGTLSDRATVTAAQTDPNSGNNSATATTTVNNARGCTRIGTSGNDVLNGGFGNDVICALSGDDSVNASYGYDTVYGGHGNDRLDGGFHNDTLNGGPGNDNLIGNSGSDRLNTVDNVFGNDTANGGSGTDSCTTDAGDTRISCP
ncbi:calcium-binding protein [Streptomyces sp. 2A115]|uniref:calcium-binding protein n=1 Tax=Streptomyces sp. 2A115 TaxID=3457439 RepID=UPI003FD3D561